LAQFTEFVQPICLWSNDFELNIDDGVIVGYGYTDSLGTLPTTPKKLKTSIVSNENCFFKSPSLAALSSTRTFCAGSADGRGTCNGDSGGGFYIKYQGKFYLRGIISASLIKNKSCDVSTYAIYTDVFKFQDWIDEVTAS
jgi:secreted trypsin-like serine protease